MVAGQPIGPQEIPAHQNPVVGLQRNHSDTVAHARARRRREIRIQGAIGIHAADIVDGRPIEIGKLTTDQHPAIQLNRQRPHGRIGTGPQAGHEIGVQGTIGIQADQVRSRDSVVMGE